MLEEEDEMCVLDCANILNTSVHRYFARTGRNNIKKISCRAPLSSISVYLGLKLQSKLSENLCEAQFFIFTCTLKYSFLILLECIALVNQASLPPSQ